VPVSVPVLGLPAKIDRRLPADKKGVGRVLARPADA
jgi:hypothetical protein